VVRPPAKSHTPRFGSIAAAAAYLGCSPRTVRRMVASGQIAGYRLNKRLLRVDLNELDAALRPVPAVAS